MNGQQKVVYINKMDTRKEKRLDKQLAQKFYRLFREPC